MMSHATDLDLTPKEIQGLSTTVRDCIVAAVNCIIEIERDRGEIARSERSLAPAAQPLQDLLDRILFRMAGLTDDDAAGLEERLARVL